MKTTLILKALSAVLIIGLAASSVQADPSAGKLDNGKTSLTKLVPPITRVFDYSGDIGERGTMFGDLGGIRNELYDKGFTLDAQFTQVYQGVSSGGSASGKGGAQWNGLLEINSTLDTAKLGFWSGGLITGTLMSSWDTPLESEAGNVSPVNDTTLWPVPFDSPRTEMTEYYLSQGLPHNMMLIAGRIDATNFLDTNSLANNPESQFLNTSLNNLLLWGSFMSFSTYGAIFVTPVTDGLKIALAAWTPDTQPGDYGGDWSDYAVLVNPIFDYHLGGLPGTIQVVAAYSSADAVALDNSALVPDLITGTTPSTKDDNYMFTLNGEQYLWAPKGASVPRAEGGRKEDFSVPTQDYAINRPGVGLFYRAGYTPKDRNAWNINVSGGLGARGIIPGRPYDRMGLGVYWLKLSSDLDDQPGNLFEDEVGVEAYYNFAITPWLQLSADVQWINPGITSSDDAVVLGTRLNTRF
jgi:porin